MAYNAVPSEDTELLSDEKHSNPSLSSSLSLRDCFPDLDIRARSLQTDAMDRPRTVSREGSVLRHPTPDLQSLQGAYISNVERLEQSAERLSVSGSDIGEELRKLRMEQRKSESRRSSIMGAHIEEEEDVFPLQQETSHGFGSHASSSIVETNHVARSGGFSPAAYFASPRGSIRSGSWSHQSSIKGRSASYGTRLTQLSEPEQEGKPLDSPMSSHYVLVPSETEQSPSSPLRVINDRAYNLDNVDIPHTDPEEPEMADNEQEPRPSTDTYRATTGLFADFDGVHLETQLHEEQEPQDTSNRRISSLPPISSRPMSYMEPTAGENMVYYPAPVPMMLNLPKRLSKLPAAPQRDKRRSQVLDSLPIEARKSAAWLPDTGADPEAEIPQKEDHPAINSKPPKRRTMADMPPQLRASMFFDYPAIQQDIEVKGESAVATLDSILDASAFAPVSAFTDHPFAGQVGAEVYGKAPGRARASEIPAEAKTSRRRRSTIDLLTRRSSNLDILDENETQRTPNKLRKRNSNSTLLQGAAKRNSSAMSLATNFGKRKSSAQQYEDAQEYHTTKGDMTNDEQTPLQHANGDDTGSANGDVDFHDAQEEMSEELEDVEQPEQAHDELIGQPTTLLAELQMRKKQQKERNRTAATAFPNGMHSTLLQLDAVAQVQKQARKQKHTLLAWEDPNADYPGAENEDDEDVPLGMLFPGRKLNVHEMSNRFDEDRPLGLIAQRQMEDEEPLSHRRARLRGEPFVREASLDDRNGMHFHDLPGVSDTLPEAIDKPIEDEAETLGQRIRRIKATQIPVQPRPVSGDFASEMMSQLGGPSEQPPQKPDNDPHAIAKTPDASKEETLGQRRKRLQAEAENKSRNVSGDSGGADPAQPPDRNRRRSMADILQAHPAAGASSRPIPNELKFVPAPKTRNTPWAIHQTRQASMGTLPTINGFGGGNNERVRMVGQHLPHPMLQKSMEVDARQRDMVDRWRQSVTHQ